MNWRMSGTTSTATFELLAQALLRGEGLVVRALWMELLGVPWASLTEQVVVSENAEVRLLAEGLRELMALRRGESTPATERFTEQSGRGRFLVKAATERKRALLRETSPEPLRRRGFFVPANFLEVA